MADDREILACGELTPEWQQLDPLIPPACSGVYGFYLQQSQEWFYIGKADNIAQRFCLREHPIHIAKSLAQPVDFLYIPSHRPLALESQLIKQLNPLGNGGSNGSPFRTLGDVHVSCELPWHVYGFFSYDAPDCDHLPEAWCRPRLVQRAEAINYVIDMPFCSSGALQDLIERSRLWLQGKYAGIVPAPDGVCIVLVRNHEKYPWYARAQADKKIFNGKTTLGLGRKGSKEHLEYQCRIDCRNLKAQIAELERAIVQVNTTALNLHQAIDE